MPEHQQIQQSKKPNTAFQKQATPVIQTPLSNPYSIIQRAKINPKSLTHADIMQLQRTIGNRAVGRLLSGIGNTSTAQQATVQRQEIPEEEEPLQGKMAETVQRQEIPEEEEPLQGKFENKPEIACPSCFAAPIVQRQELEEEEPLQGKMIEPLQLQEIPEEEEPLQGKFTKTIQRQEIPEEEEPLQTKKENNTGMPDNLKAGVERLSGIDMSDVKVHYNSSRPAEVGALAYTQGTNIHVATGQERHLPHEAWHVVQQVQGRVQPTLQLKEGVPINDDVGLEQEADMMGIKAARTKTTIQLESSQKQMGKWGKRVIAQESAHVVQRTNLEPCLQLWTIGGAPGLKKGHEIITSESLKRLKALHPESYKKLLLLYLGGKKAKKDIIAGSRWNDDPHYLTTVLVDYIGKGLKATAITHRSHHGDMQFLHSMAKAEETAQQTKDKMMGWAKFCYLIANGTIGPYVRLSNVGSDFIKQLFSDEEYRYWTVGELFGVTDINRLRGLAIGSMLHMIEDSYCASHTQRKKSGEIIAFQNYNEQDGDRHGLADKLSEKRDGESEVDRTPDARNAREACTYILFLLSNRTDWNTVSNYIRNDVLGIMNGHEQGLPVATRHFRKSIHKQFIQMLKEDIKKLPKGTDINPLNDIIRASKEYDKLLLYRSDKGAQHKEEKEKIYEIIKSIMNLSGTMLCSLDSVGFLLQKVLQDKKEINTEISNI